MNSTPHKYFLNFTMAHLTVSDSPTKLCLYITSGNTVDLKMKSIGPRRITSRYFSNSHFSPSFSCDSDFFASDEISDCRSTALVPSLDQYILMWNLLYGSGLDKVGPDKVSFFSHSSNLWSSGFYRFCIITISSFLDIVPG